MSELALEGALTSDGRGGFRGCTSIGGAGGNGNIFRVDAGSGTFTTLIEFTGLTGAVAWQNPDWGGGSLTARPYVMATAPGA